MAVRFQLRRDTAANWASANSVLALGEPGVETDTLKVKVGDGSTAWNSLAYSITKDFTDLTSKPTTLAGYGITDSLALNALSVTQNAASGNGTLTYNNATGVFSYTPPNFQDLDGNFTGSVFADNSTVMVDGVSATLNFVNNDTDDLAEGSTNLYYTDARAQAAIGSGLADPEYHSGAIIDLIGDGGDFFKREVTVNGVRIVAAGAVGGQTAVPDAFVEKVARMFELFTDVNGAGINETSQRTFIKTLSGDAGTYHAAVGPTLQRVARGAGADYTPNFLTDAGIASYNLSPLFDSHVANDMVWYLNSTGDPPGDGDNDAQEVIEHVFHTLHMHGLDAVSLKMYSYISADWASGPLYAAMEEAYDAGKWDSSGYGGNAWKTDGDAFEVAAKEYLFLLNFGMFEYSSLWDGGSLSPEWTDDMRTQSGIQANNPLGYALHNTYIAPVISKPSLTTIRSIFQDGDVGDPSIAGSSGYTVDTESSEVEYYPTTGAFTVNTTFANLKTTPTTIAGYGINDAYTKAEVDAIIESPSGNLTGSVFADDSSIMIDGVAGKIVGQLEVSDPFISGTIDSTDSSPITITPDVVMSAGLTIGNHIIPSSNENIDLGSASARFRDLYLSGNSAIIGDLALKRHTGGGLIVSDHSTGDPTNITTHNITANDVTAAGNVDVTGNLTMTGYIAGPATMTIDPAAVGDNTGTLVVAGNLQVDGTTTTINSQTLEVEDKNVVLGPNAANDAANNGAGITVTQPDTSDATLVYNTTDTQWEFNKDLDVAGVVTTTEINLDATGDIHSTVDTGYVGIAGGTNSNVGANALFYGGTHATLAGVTKFRSGSTGTVTILANGNVGIGYDSPSDNIHILGSNASPNVGITLQSDDTANATAAISLFARNASNINITSEIKNVAGQLFIERSDAGTDVLALKSTAAGAGGPQLDFYHHSASPAAGDTVGRINFNGYDDGSNATTYARIDGVANDVTNGTEKGHLVFSNRVDGSTFSEALRIDDEAGVFTGGQITGRGGGATSHLFHIDGTSKYYFELQQSDTSGNTDILFSDGTGGDYGIVGYEHANDLMQFYTKSSRRMVIDENGNVGIGTASPDLKLHVDGTNGYPANSGTTPVGHIAIRAKNESSSHGAHIGVADVSPWGTWIQAQDANNLATSYPLLLNPNGGHVGIGTTSPNAKLQVDAATGTSTNATDATLMLRESSGSATAGLGSQLSLSFDWNNSGNFLDGAPFIRSYKVNSNNTDYNSGLKLGTRTNGVGTATVAMTIDHNQNVGIGTDSPTFGTIDTYAQRGLHISGNKESGTAAVIRLSETGSGLGNFEIRSNRNGATSGNILAFGESNDTFMVLRGDDDGGGTSTRGLLGIGTQSPSLADVSDSNGINIFNEGNDTKAGIRLSACNNTGTPGQVFNTEIRYNGASGQYQILHYGSGSSAGTERFRIDATGDSYTNDGTISSISDIRVKKDIADLEDGLSLVNQLRPVTFKYNGLAQMAPDDDKINYGFIADEVQAVAPQYVKEDTQEIDGETVTDFKSLSTGRMVPMLFKAVQELSAQVETLQAEINTLKGE